MVFPDHRRLKPRKGYAFRRRLKHMLKHGASPASVNTALQGWMNHIRFANTIGLRKALLGDCGLAEVGNV
jgi:hypothetical protein